MMRYLQYDLLKSSGLEHFDSWAANFGETITALEMAPEGTGFRSKTRFAKFFNLPELMAMCGRLLTFRRRKCCACRFRRRRKSLKLPPQRLPAGFGGRPGGTGRSSAKPGGEPREDNMLKITSDGRKLALDQRLSDPTLPDDPESKVNACVRNVLQVWRDTEGNQGDAACILRPVYPKGGWFLQRLRRYEAKADGPGCTAGGRNRLYSRCKDRGSESGAFCKGAERTGAGAAWFHSQNGRGHQRTDAPCRAAPSGLPWRPADIEQREGRILRQGNMNQP